MSKKNKELEQKQAAPASEEGVQAAEGAQSPAEGTAPEISPAPEAAAGTAPEAAPAASGKEKQEARAAELAKKSGMQEAKAEKKQAEKRKKAPDKNKKPNVFVRMGRKIKETFSELKRVTWPTFGKALKATGVVLVIVLVFTVVVTGINYGLSALLDVMTGTGA